MSLLSPPHGMSSVNESLQTNVLLDAYVEAYEKRYGGKPVFPSDNEHISIFRELQKMLGIKGIPVVQHYLKMNDEWFIKRGHCIEELKRNINAVNADYHKKHSHNSEGLRIRTLLSCDSCFKYFEDSVTPGWLDSGVIRLCKGCRGENGIQGKIHEGVSEVRPVVRDEREIF